MLAALTPDHKYLNLAVVNATEQEQKFDLSVNGAHVTGPSTLWRLTGSSIDAANHTGQPAATEIRENPIGDTRGTISIAPISVNIYRLSIAQ